MDTGQTLSGHVAFITGGAKRVGAAIGTLLHAHGCNIVIHYRQSATAADNLAATLNTTRPDSATTVAGDLLDTDSLPGLVDRAARAFGRLDVLVNNASTFYPTPLGSVTPAAWADLVGTNLKAPLFLAQAAMAELATRRGLILNLIDIHAQRPLPDHAVYSTAKAGLAMLTRALARELGPDIRVNGISPGPVLWPESGIDPGLKAEIIDRTALKRSGTADDVARAALYFVRDAPYVTGQILAVDGGRSIGW